MWCMLFPFSRRLAPYEYEVLLFFRGPLYIPLFVDLYNAELLCLTSVSDSSLVKEKLFLSHILILIRNSIKVGTV